MGITKLFKFSSTQVTQEPNPQKAPSKQIPQGGVRVESKAVKNTQIGRDLALAPKPLAEGIDNVSFQASLKSGAIHFTDTIFTLDPQEKNLTIPTTLFLSNDQYIRQRHQIENGFLDINSEHISSIAHVTEIKCVLLDKDKQVIQEVPFEHGLRNTFEVEIPKNQRFGFVVSVLPEHNLSKLQTYNLNEAKNSRGKFLTAIFGIEPHVIAYQESNKVLTGASVAYDRDGEIISGKHALTADSSQRASILLTGFESSIYTKKGKIQIHRVPWVTHSNNDQVIKIQFLDYHNPIHPLATTESDLEQLEKDLNAGNYSKFETSGMIPIRIKVKQ